MFRLIRGRRMASCGGAFLAAPSHLRGGCPSLSPPPLPLSPPQLDELTTAAGLFKVETVGPVYMVSAARGVPPPFSLPLFFFLASCCRCLHPPLSLPRLRMPARFPAPGCRGPAELHPRPLRAPGTPGAGHARCGAALQGLGGAAAGGARHSPLPNILYHLIMKPSSPSFYHPRMRLMLPPLTLFVPRR